MKPFMRPALLLTAALALPFAAACGSDTTDSGGLSADAPRVLLSGEKADDFRSESAQEYFVKGTTTITLDASYGSSSEEERLQRVRELIPYKQVVIGYFLNTYLIDKSEEDAGYGGFRALTKNGSYEDMNVRPVEDQGEGLTYAFDFVQEVGGQLDLLEELSERAEGEFTDNGYTMELIVGKISNDEMMRLEHESEWYRSAPWSGFDPAKVDASRLDSQVLHLEPQERSADAWIDYGRLFEDGKVEIGVFFGWDYHGDYHRKHAKATYEYLVGAGFASPTSSWERYKDERAALTRTIDANGEPVNVSITLWWGEPGTSTDADTDAGGRALEDAMRASLKANEVTVFSGHSGPWYGFALANWKTTSEGDLDDHEIPTLEMPADTYQIVLAEGCDTYALGEAFWANPAKADRTTLDIVTTTSFSDAGQPRAVTDFLAAIAGTDRQGRHEPVRYSDLLSDLDSNSYWFKSMYGVHGLDDNPHSHPYANLQAVCGECQRDADCGGLGNRCVDIDGAAVCTYECTADDGCLPGYSCRRTETRGTLTGSVCTPESFSCEL